MCHGAQYPMTLRKRNSEASSRRVRLLGRMRPAPHGVHPRGRPGPRHHRDMAGRGPPSGFRSSLPAVTQGRRLAAHLDKSPTSSRFVGSPKARRSASLRFYFGGQTTFGSLMIEEERSSLGGGHVYYL